jgi:hypothetical protein
MTTPPFDLPPNAVSAYGALTSEQKSVFIAHDNGSKRSMALMVALSILFPIQLFLLGRIRLGILFAVTGGGLGVWYIIESFLTPGRVRESNAKVASQAIALIEAGARDEE